ncbi:RNA-guided endonuclease TnpB family protein [Kordiimonas sp.]|uniref:RNA-guided endonuclease TnpB family protein n=1 Tax=Kordiimonas sp. TaxID=1970157 RepID=UPI003A902C1D
MSVKSYKYRFYPTPEQELILAQTFGCVRYVYNRALKYRADTYKTTGKGASFCDTSAELTKWKKEPETSWLKDVSCVPLQQTLRHLNAAYSGFFAKRSKYPSFKRKSRNQSAEFTRSAFKWDRDKQRLTVAKIGRLRIRWSRKFEANPSTITVSKSPSGKYFVSIRIDEANRVAPKASNEIGIDLGITTLAVTSDGERITNSKYTNRYARKLAKAQRSLSRKTKGSNRREKARTKVAKIQERIANSRLDRTHKVTTRLINENQVICVETLKSSNMMKNRKLAKSIADCSWFEFVRQLEYKAEWYGRTLVKINQWFPSSKTCSGCGHVVEKMPLSIREWKCQVCGAQHDRDHNAAINILAAGRAERRNERGESISRKTVTPVDRNSRRNVKQLEGLHS